MKKTTKNFKELLTDVKAFAFDVDGVFSTTVTLLDSNGEMFRTANIKDGYIIQLLAKKGYPIAIITGGNFAGVEKRFEKLGVKDIYLSASEKITALKEFINKYGVDPANVLYMGDDIPDLIPMEYVGIPVCPSDAAEEIKAVSLYISDKKGGEGCVRDVVEQVLRAKGEWLNPEDHIW